jgi:hypothetical protein
LATTGPADRLENVAIEIRHDVNDGGGEYVLVLDGEVIGELDHVDRDGVRSFTHTGVRPAHRGHEYAAELVRRGLDDARAEGLAIEPACSYVVSYLRLHPEDRDLVAGS